MDQGPMSEDKRGSPGDKVVRAHVWVKGRVQGVGFRAHVEYYARQMNGLTGWVRNVGDDTVEAIAEGDRAAVERFIQMMKDGPRAARVDESKVEWEESTGEFDRFGVKRSM
ncbi:MAG TPA: acylphosphatase [Anaerolineales bacterium]|nr:acylphosphatase [Anaerolineales bacterium]